MFAKGMLESRAGEESKAGMSRTDMWKLPPLSSSVVQLLI